ncbi:hypothetical protein [Pseudorhodobacter sp. MZDSW-24AT]|uniref:hypothetical protein n=1 Tax=Pseudorhodobacter sp. MZDSW-24AT TaxID=2052957 RepID=UPI000C1F53D2|nr:hypothetical protein [Pseudorhodobacter sp. MZDSW-24AT]PJF10567.1 hypothetical protein CUR21_04305 [Pseudorhodobacter sp. MZDSW-24AT]
MVASRGWEKIGPHPAIQAWAAAALPVAQRAIVASGTPWRCGGTWFVGVDALPNLEDGEVAAVAFPWCALPLTPLPLHRGQLSVIRPGYPQPSAEETAAAFAFRQQRDAAHLDGVLPVGPDRRRMIREPHAWVLGLPLTDIPAAPLVVWEGSHRIMAAALREALAPYPPQSWAEVDITVAYQSARSQVFKTCRRVELPARLGEATLLHRMTLHGVAPWEGAAQGDRIIAYFRPQLSCVEDWIVLP